MKNNKLQRKLDFYDGMGVIISIMIGSGIFASPGIVLKHANTPSNVLLSWFLSGIIVMLTSLCYTELGSRYPSAGGDYEYLVRAYGNHIGFTFIWYYFWISKPGSQAIIATVFGDYLLRALYGRNHHFNNNNDNRNSDNNIEYLSKLFSITLIILLTSINCLGIKESSTLMNILTLLKLLLILFITINGIVHIFTNPSIIESNFSNSNSNSNSLLSFNFEAISSLIPCLWAYDGWADINFLLEEFKSTTSSKYLSLLVCSSIFVVMLCYLLTNVAYFSVLSSDSIMNTTTIGLDYGYTIHHIVGVIMTIGIIMSTVGSAHGSILTGGRAFYAVARDGQAPHILSKLNRNGAPYVSLIAQATWTIVLLLLPGSNYFSLLSYFGPSSWFYYALTGASLLILPKPTNLSNPQLNSRINKLFDIAPPIILILISSTLVINGFLTSPRYCSLAFSFILLSLPVWWICNKLGFIDKKNNSDSNGDGDGNGDYNDDNESNDNNDNNNNNNENHQITMKKMNISLNYHDKNHSEDRNKRNLMKMYNPMRFLNGDSSLHSHNYNHSHWNNQSNYNSHLRYNNENNEDNEDENVEFIETTIRI